MNGRGFGLIDQCVQGPVESLDQHPEEGVSKVFLVHLIADRDSVFEDGRVAHIDVLNS
jgi:hypothetical protein